VVLCWGSSFLARARLSTRLDEDQDDDDAMEVDSAPPAKKPSVKVVTRLSPILHAASLVRLCTAAAAAAWVSLCAVACRQADQRCDGAPGCARVRRWMWQGAGTVLTLERPWVDVMARLPEPIVRPKYGS
jgi:hypothetical protein